MKWCVVLSILVISSCNSKEDVDPLEKILSTAPDIVQDVISDRKNFEVQIRYTQIDRDSLNRPSFTSYEFNVDNDRYFYPASTVKMPIAILAMEYMNELRDSLNDDRINIHAAIEIDSLRKLQSRVLGDSTSGDGHASIAHYVKKIFTVSDNDAYNRLFEMMGREYINDRLEQKGYDGININHRLSLFGIDNQYTPSWRLKNKKEIIFEQSEQIDSQERPNRLTSLIKGKGFIDIENQLVNEPFDFTHKNAFSIKSLEDVLKAVLFPESVPTSARFDLTESDYAYLHKCMSILPRESEYPKYDQWDSYVKFFLFGDKKDTMPDHIRIFNKVGDAYGYLTDCAYVVDYDNRVEFLLTVAISVNANQIYNDGVYEYDKIGFPFMAAIGKAVYDYELKRDRAYHPDLSRFQNLNYD